MEVGPLARVVIMYAQGNEAVREGVNRFLGELNAASALYSILGRTAARGIECSALAGQMRSPGTGADWHNRRGDTTVFNDALFDPASWPAQAQGVGFMEAPRGALAHWVVIANGLIENFQVVVPTTWNASPRHAWSGLMTLPGGDTICTTPANRWRSCAPSTASTPAWDARCNCPADPAGNEELLKIRAI